MDKLYNPENINKLGTEIIRAAENNDILKFDSLIVIMKVLINGPPGERCQNFYNRTMPPDRCIAAVLRAKCIQNALQNDIERCEQLIDMLLALPYLTDQLCRALSMLITCLSPLSEMKKSIATRILAHEDLYKFDLKSVQYCLEQDTSELEATMMKICTINASHEEFFKLFDHWIRWCSQSAYVFWIVSSIFNELLRRVKCKKQVHRVIGMFIKELQITCDINRIDMVLLYPYEIQNLVSLLLVEPEDLKMEEEGFSVILKCIRNKFHQLTKSYPHSALLLSSHFPQWNKFLE